MQIEHHIQAALFAGLHEGFNQTENGLPIPGRTFLDHNLVESEPDMVHPKGGDALHIRFRNVPLEEFEIADGQRQFPLLGQHIEAFENW